MQANAKIKLKIEFGLGRGKVETVEYPLDFYMI